MMDARAVAAAPGHGRRILPLLAVEPLVLLELLRAAQAPGGG